MRRRPPRVEEMKEPRRCARCDATAVRGSDYCFQHDSGAETAYQRAISHDRKRRNSGLHKVRGTGWSTRTEEVTRLTLKSNAREIKRLREIIAWCMDRLILPPDHLLGDLEMVVTARSIAAQVRKGGY